MIEIELFINESMFTLIPAEKIHSAVFHPLNYFQKKCNMIRTWTKPNFLDKENMLPNAAALHQIHTPQKLRLNRSHESQCWKWMNINGRAEA